MYTYNIVYNKFIQNLKDRFLKKALFAPPPLRFLSFVIIGRRFNARILHTTSVEETELLLS